jgi:hypothetical protein
MPKYRSNKANKANKDKKANKAITAKKDKKANKAKTANKNKKKHNENKVIHFFDDNNGYDKNGFFSGITFKKNKIETIMCTGNIVCHKVPNPNNNLISKKKYYELINKYVARITNPNMRNYIKHEIQNMIEYNPTGKDKYWAWYDVECGLTKEQIYFLKNPDLKDIIVCFDMDATLHQTSGIEKYRTSEFIKILSNLTKSKITYDDLGELYFGGKKRLDSIKEMFTNLNNTIGMQNVYVITANQTTSIPEILPDLYSKLFNVKFLRKNVRQSNKEMSKFDIIKEIMDS